MIYKRTDSPFWWMSVERPGRGRVRRSTGVVVDAPTPAQRAQQKRDAEAVYALAQADAARHAAGLPARYGAASTFDRYATWYDAHVLAPQASVARQRSMLGHLRMHFGEVRLDLITAADILAYRKDRLAAGRMASTVRQEERLVGRMLRRAVPDHVSQLGVDFTKLPPLRAVEREGRTLSREEEARLLTTLRRIDRPLFIVAVSTLLRISSLLDLEWKDVRGTVLHVKTKTGPHAVPLAMRAQQALASVPRTNGHVFAAHVTSETRSGQIALLHSRFKRACWRADIPYGAGVGVTWHSATRHTGATRLVQAGVSLRVIQAIGGWKSLRQLTRYTHPEAADLTSAVDLI